MQLQSTHISNGGSAISTTLFHLDHFLSVQATSLGVASHRCSRGAAGNRMQALRKLEDCQRKAWGRTRTSLNCGTEYHKWLVLLCIWDSLRMAVSAPKHAEVFKPIMCICWHLWLRGQKRSWRLHQTDEITTTNWPTSGAIPPLLHMPSWCVQGQHRLPDHVFITKVTGLNDAVRKPITDGSYSRPEIMRKMRILYMLMAEVL